LPARSCHQHRPFSVFPIPHARLRSGALAEDILHANPNINTLCWDLWLMGLDV
jgi:hypothetical protein